MSDTAETYNAEETAAAVSRLSGPSVKALDLPGQSANEDSTGMIANPLVQVAAQSLIDYKRAYNHPVRLESFDVPHEALVSIAEQLDALGASRVLKESLMRALKDYVMSKGGSFARAANAKPVYIALQVADQKPESRFKDGVTEMSAIDGTTVLGTEGVSAVNVRLTASGTATTSNAANVDKMFAHVKGVKLWVQFEAPTAEELDGLLTGQQIALAAVGETVGGAMSAAELKDTLRQLQDEGRITPEITALLENMIEMRALAEAGPTPESEARIAELNEQVVELVTQGLENETIPLPLAQGAIQSLAQLSETYDLGGPVPANTRQELNIKTQAAELTQKLEGLVNSLDPETQAATVTELEALIETIEGTKGQDLAKTLTELPDRLAALDVPEILTPQITEISADAATVQADIAARLTEPESVLAQPSEEISTADMSAESVQDTLVTPNDPDMQTALPQETLEAADTVLPDHPELAEATAVESIVREPNQILENGDVDTEQAGPVQETIAALETGEERIPSIDPVKLQASLQKTDSLRTGPIDAPRQPDSLQRIIKVTAAIPPSAPPQVRKAVHAVKPRAAESSARQPHVSPVKASPAKPGTVINTPKGPENITPAPPPLQTDSPASPPAVAANTPVSIQPEAVQKMAKALAHVVKANDLPPQQQQQLQNIVNKIETGQPVSVQDISTLDRAAETANNPQIRTRIKTAIAPYRAESGLPVPARPQIPSTAPAHPVPTGPRSVAAPTSQNHPPSRLPSHNPPPAPPVNRMPPVPDAAPAAPPTRGPENAPARSPEKKPATPVKGPESVAVPATPPPPPQKLATNLKNIADHIRQGNGAPHAPGEPANPLSAPEKVIVETVEAVARKLEKSPPDQPIPAKDAEAILNQLDTAINRLRDNPDPERKAQLEALRQGIVDNVDNPKALPENLRTGPCNGCGGGNCASCGSSFNSVTPPPKHQEPVSFYKVNPDSKPDSKIVSNDSVFPPAEDPARPVGGGCPTPCGGDCGSCGTSFTKAADPLDYVEPNQNALWSARPDSTNLALTPR